MPIESPLPPLFPRHIRRPRLTRILDATSAQTILLLAPAGYGKTTLAAEWLQANELAVWYRATPASADVAAFSVGVAEVVQPIVPGAGERLHQRVRIGDAPEHAARALAELLAEDLAAWPEKAWLVVDDYHLVMESKATEEFVETLLALAPVKFLATSRKRPPWATRRKALYGSILELGAPQLAMTSKEATRILQALAPSEARHLIASSDGWPVLLGLGSLAQAGAVPGVEMSEILFPYLAEEVLLQETPATQDFLLRISPLPNLTPEHASALTGNESAADQLEQLVRSGLATRRGDTYALHPLLRAFLRARFHRDFGSTAQSVTKRAIDLARLARNWAVAFELATEAGALESAVEIAGAATEDLLASGRLETLEKWLRVCGPRALADPGLALAHADILFRKNKLAEAEYVASTVAHAVPKSDPQASRAWFLAGHAAYVSGEFARAYQAQQRAGAAADRQRDKVNAAWGAFAAGHVLNRRDTIVHLADLEQLATVMPDINTQLRVMTARQVNAARDGSLAGIWESWQLLLPHIETADPLASSCAYANIAWLHACRSDYQLSMRFAQDALGVCARYRLEVASLPCLYVLGRAQFGLRQYARLERTLVRLALDQSGRSDPYIAAIHTCLAVRYHLCAGAPQEALRLAAYRTSRNSDPHVEGEILALGALAAACLGEHSEVAELVGRSRELSTEAIVRIIGAFADLIGLEDQLERAAAQDTLGRTILDADRTQSLDGMVVAYRSYPRLLSLVSPGSPEATVTAGLMIRARDKALARQYALVARTDVDPSRLLTPRELEVARLLREGLTNREIAKCLVISPSTAKVHVHHIMKKLNVATRAEIDLKLDP